MHLIIQIKDECLWQFCENFKWTKQQSGHCLCHWLLREWRTSGNSRWLEQSIMWLRLQIRHRIEKSEDNEAIVSWIMMVINDVENQRMKMRCLHTRFSRKHFSFTIFLLKRTEQHSILSSIVAWYWSVGRTLNVQLTLSKY